MCAVVVLLYFPVAAGGYFVYGNKLQDNVLEAVSHGPALTVIQCLITLHLFCSFIIVINPLCQELEEVLRFPTGGCLIPPSPLPPSLPSVLPPPPPLLPPPLPSLASPLLLLFFLFLFLLFLLLFPLFLLLLSLLFLLLLLPSSSSSSSSFSSFSSSSSSSSSSSGQERCRQVQRYVTTIQLDGLERVGVDQE